MSIDLPGRSSKRLCLSFTFVRLVLSALLARRSARICLIGFRERLILIEERFCPAVDGDVHFLMVDSDAAGIN